MGGSVCEWGGACVNGGISGRRRNVDGICDVMGVRVGRMYNMSMLCLHRYSESAFLCNYYGTAEIPQAFRQHQFPCSVL